MATKKITIPNLLAQNIAHYSPVNAVKLDANNAMLEAGREVVYHGAQKHEMTRVECVNDANKKLAEAKATCQTTHKDEINNQNNGTVANPLHNANSGLNACIIEALKQFSADETACSTAKTGSIDTLTGEVESALEAGLFVDL